MTDLGTSLKVRLTMILIVMYVQVLHLRRVRNVLPPKAKVKYSLMIVKESAWKLTLSSMTFQLM